MKLNTASQNSQVAKLATDHASSVLTIYTGSAPATANDAATGTTLVTHTLAGFAAPSNGVITANSIAPSNNINGGTPGYARLSNGTQTLQLTVGTSSAEVIVSTNTFIAGVSNELVSLQLSQPAG